MKTPLYYQRYYAKIYENEKAFKFFSWKLVWQILSCFKRNSINKSVLKSVGKKDSVLILGISFDNLIYLVCKKAKRVDVVDVSYSQIEFMKEKYKAEFKNLDFIWKNATTEIKEKYDVVICNNLLHEVPNASKSKIVNNALKSTKVAGTTVFVDYHMPSKYFIFKPLVKTFNRLNQPFAEKMWDKSIVTYAKNKLKYSWRKTTFAMGCFQKVVARRKPEL